MNRYLNSFFITIFIYVAFGSFIFWFLEKDFIKSKEQIKTICLNNLTILETPKIEVTKNEKVIENTQVTKTIEKPKEEKEIIKKVDKEEKIVKTIKKEPKKLQANKNIPTPNKSINKEKIVEKEIKKAENSSVKELQKENTKIVTPQKMVVDEKKDYLDKHLHKIRELISKKIIYPHKAKKFAVQGVVLVQFKILTNGAIEDITILDGHRFLHNSTIEAIKEASKEFPKVAKELEIQIPIEYKLI